MAVGMIYVHSGQDNSPSFAKTAPEKIPQGGSSWIMAFDLLSAMMAAVFTVTAAL